MCVCVFATPGVYALTQANHKPKDYHYRFITLLFLKRIHQKENAFASPLHNVFLLEGNSSLPPPVCTEKSRTILAAGHGVRPGFGKNRWFGGLLFTFDFHVTNFE